MHSEAGRADRSVVLVLKRHRLRRRADYKNPTWPTLRHRRNHSNHLGQSCGM
jgi:hypothetical protein